MARVMDTSLDIREAWPSEAEAASALLGSQSAPGMTLVAQTDEGMRAACHCRCTDSAGCDAQVAVSPDAGEDAAWQLVNRAIGRVLSTGAHRFHVDGSEQIDAIWHRAQWGEQPDFSEAAHVVRVMGRR